MLLYFSTLEKILLFLLTLIFFFWGLNSNIQTSEFWSITSSKYFFDISFIDTIVIKPLFHFFLFLFHKIKLNSVQHIIIVKIVFSIFGSLIIFFFYSLLKIMTHRINNKATWLPALFGIAILLSSPFFLQNYFRVRTDILSTLLFIIFLINYSQEKLTIGRYIFFITLFPLLSIKSLFFSFLVFLAFLLDVQHKRKFSITGILFTVLIVLAFFITILNINWHSFLYISNSYVKFLRDTSTFFAWIKSEFLTLIANLISLLIFLTSKNNYLKKTAILMVLFFICIILIPQKYGFFLGSISPFLYIIPTLMFAKVTQKSTYTSSIAILLFCLVLFHRVYSLLDAPNLYNSNQHQIKFIQVLEPYLQSSKLSYLDGSGIFPRGNFIPCFVSPNDEMSNNFCLQSIHNKVPDVVILTQRLTTIIQPVDILKNGYLEASHNIYVEKRLATHIPFQDLQLPALLIFGFEK